MDTTRQLETKSLLIRPFIHEDLKMLAKLNSDLEVMKYISAQLTQSEVQQVIDWFTYEWDRLGYGWFAIFEKKSHKFVGQCGLQCLEGKADSIDTELAFVIAKEFWGKGYGTEASKAVLDFGFNQANLETIFAVTMPENVAAKKLLKKLGFEFKHNQKMYQRIVELYTLKRSEYNKQSNNFN